MQGQILLVSPEAVDPRILPDIGPIAPGRAEAEGVGVGRGADLVDKDQFMLRPVEASHAAIGLFPDDEVLQLRIDLPSGGLEFAHVAPVHADEMDGAIRADLRHRAERGFEKAGERDLVHLARGHGELAVPDGAGAADMTVDLHIVRRVGEHAAGPFVAHQRRIGRRLPGVAADQPMAPELPDIAALGDSRAGFGLRNVIRRICPGAVTVIEQEVELRRFESGDLQIEIEVEFGQRLELDRQDLAIPAGQLGQPVVGDHIGPALGLREMAEFDRRNLVDTELPGRGDAPVAGHDLAAATDQDRIGESELADRRSDLGDLLRRMGPGIALVGRKLVDPSIDDLEPEALRQGWSLGSGLLRSHLGRPQQHAPAGPSDRSHKTSA